MNRQLEHGHMQVRSQRRTRVFSGSQACQAQVQVSCYPNVYVSLVTLNHTLSPTRFSSLDWIDQLDDKGIIAGGMEDGAITLWSASKILESGNNTQQ